MTRDAAGSAVLRIRSPMKSSSSDLERVYSHLSAFDPPIEHIII
jgi:hypothetical protein